MMDRKLLDFSFLVMYLSGWEEESRSESGGTIVRTWREYLGEVIDELEHDKLIRRDKHSLVLTKAGRRKAEALKRKYY